MPIVAFFDVTRPSFWDADHAIELAASAAAAAAAATADTKNPRKSLEEASDVPEAPRIRRAGTPIDPSLAARDHSNHIPWVRLIVLFSLSALWVTAVASSSYTCGDVCAATHHGGSLGFANLCCNCVTSTPGQCPTRLGEGVSSHVLGQETGRYEATKKLDAAMM